MLQSGVHFNDMHSTSGTKRRSRPISTLRRIWPWRNRRSRACRSRPRLFPVTGHLTNCGSSSRTC